MVKKRMRSAGFECTHCTRYLQLERYSAVSVNATRLTTQYCVYCGQDVEESEMTDEHFIPKSIGGRYTIRVCERCNSRAGQLIDVQLSTSARSRAFSMRAKKNDRIPGYVQLNDGSMLKSIFYWEPSAPGEVTPRYEIIKDQGTGHIWLDECKVKAGAQLPPNVRIVRREDVEWVCLTVDSNEGREQGYFKVLLGAMAYHIAREGEMDSRTVFSHDGFSVVRSAIWNGVPWPESMSVDPNCKLPGCLAREMWEPLVYFECPEGQLFRAGVHLQGERGVRFEIENFGVVLPQVVAGYRDHRLPGPLGPF